jgi:bifunctional ADP-heptose synthase (sugar kinase/adenylyltransferase)
MDTRKKILTVEEARRRIESLSTNGKTIAVAHGWFDIIRAEHTTALAQIRQGYDELLVLVRPDSDSRSTILDESSRSQLVAALDVTDTVVLCDEVAQAELLQPLANAAPVDVEQSVTGSVIDDVLRRHGRK